MNAPAAIKIAAFDSPLEALAKLLAHELAQTEIEISSHMVSAVGLIPDVAHHLVDAGGKRLRPLLTLAAAKICGKVSPAAIKLSAAVEFIHSATLLHDDVVDGSGMRRGLRTANLIWGDKASVLVGDFLFARAFNMMVATGSMQILDILAATSSTIAEGEVLQLASASRGDIGRETYDKIISAKTAALFAAAAQSGAICAGASDEYVAAFCEYGQELGMAFQLSDDALDYGGLTQELGKSVGDDFREGKPTLPMIIAIERASDAEYGFWQMVLGRKHEEEDLQTAMQYIRGCGAIEATLQEATTRANCAKQALNVLPNSEIKDCLIELADYVVNRVS
ncbi:MAG: octaprenyl-diphosphate synthase [Hyphomonadaceae bacterium]|nr:MAG: octaprenyl-diphosphate synthase [Hyphomonadaceae bacterium]